MNTPCIVQYQGSKRKLAAQILQYMPKKFERLVEPFAGMASISIAVAINGRANQFLINNINAPLIGILKETSQSTLLGKCNITFESLYVSRSLS